MYNFPIAVDGYIVNDYNKHSVRKYCILIERFWGDSMNKIISGVVLLAMLVALTLPCSAADPPVVRGANLQATAGETIDYHVSISGNPGLSGFLLKLTYDTDVLSVLTQSDGKTVIVQPGELAGGSFVASKTESGCQILWYSPFDASEDGCLFSIRLKVSEDALLADYPIRISYSAQNTVNAADERVRLRCEDGSLSVRAYAPMLYSQDYSLSQGEEFDYCVFLQDNPGLATCGFRLIFDADTFEVVRSAETDEPLCSTQEGFAEGTLNVKAYANAVVVFWYQYKNSTVSGAFVSIRLRVKDTAPIGKAALSLKLNTGQIVDENEQEVALSVTSGTVFIQDTTQAEVHFIGNTQAQVEVTATAASRIAVAFYEPCGRLAATAIAEAEDHAASMTVTSGTDLSACRWKIFLLDQQCQPIREVLQSGR